MKKPKLIIYDWDNTLVDTTEIVTKVVNRLRSDCGYESMSAGEVLKYTGNPDCDWIESLFGGKSQKNAAKYTQYYHEENENFTPSLLFGAKKIIQTVQDMSIPQSVLTNKDSILAQDERDFLSLGDYFFAFIGKDDVLAKKPDPCGVEQIVDFYTTKYEQKIEKNEIWFIGDTMVDMATAKNYGCHAFFIGHESWITEKYRDYIIKLENLDEITRILENF